MRTPFSSMLVLASLPFLPSTVSAGKKKPCIHVTSFFYEAAECPTAVTGATVNVQQLLSSAAVIGPADLGTCEEITTNPALSYQYFLAGDGSKCTYTTYTETGCSGQATNLNLAAAQLGCIEAPAPNLPNLNLGVKSYKVSCGK